MIPLPAWVDPEAWAAFMLQKEQGLKAKRKRLTSDMEKFVLYKLDRLRTAGHDPTECLLYSMNKGYDSVYAAPDDDVPLRGVSQQVAAARQAEEAAEREHALRVSTVDAGKVRDILSAVSDKLRKRA